MKGGRRKGRPFSAMARSVTIIEATSYRGPRLSPSDGSGIDRLKRGEHAGSASAPLYVQRPEAEIKYEESGGISPMVKTATKTPRKMAERPAPRGPQTGEEHESSMISGRLGRPNLEPLSEILAVWRSLLLGTLDAQNDGRQNSAETLSPISRGEASAVEELETAILAYLCFGSSSKSCANESGGLESMRHRASVEPW